MQNNQNEKHYQDLKYLIEYLRNSFVGATPELITKYEALIKSCDELIDKIDPLFVTNENGELPQITVEQKNELLGFYQKVADSLAIVKEHKNPNFIDGKLISTANEIDNYIVNDINALGMINSPTTFAEAIAKGRKKVIDITGKEVKNVGENLSQRQIITKENGEKAVFTKATKYTNEDLIANHIEKYCIRYPEYAELFQAIQNNGALSDMRADQIGFSHKIPCIDPNNPAFKRACPTLANSYNYNNELRSAFNKMSSDPAFPHIMYQFIKDSNALSTSSSFNKDTLKIQKNIENIDDRNSGMSIVAGLLGVPNLIAHSEPVTIKNGDQMIEGTLMDFAEGKDLNNLALNDEARSFKKGVLSSVNARYSIANLQVLDFICGNIDRHGANMFYSFGKNLDGKTQLIGIMGIDNDASFADLDENAIELGCNRMLGIDDLLVIEEDMANRISALTPAMLKLSLKGLTINSKAIEGACNRLVMIQEKIKNAVVFQKGAGLKRDNMNILKKEDFGNFGINTLLQTAKNSYFGTVSGMLKEASTSLVYEYKDRLRNASAAKLKLHGNLNPLKKSIPEDRANIKGGTKWWRGTSQQYENILTEATELSRQSQTISLESSETEIKNYIENIKTMKSHVQAYLDRKNLEAHPTNPRVKPKKFGTYTKHRIDVMNDFLRNLNIKEEEINKNTEDIKKYESEATEIERIYSEAAEEKRKAAAAKNPVVNNPAVNNNAPVNNNPVVNNNAPVNPAPVNNNPAVNNAPVNNNPVVNNAPVNNPNFTNKLKLDTEEKLNATSTKVKAPEDKTKVINK